jgi:hypothetical protein
MRIGAPPLLTAVDAAARLSTRRPVDESLARVQQFYIVQRCLVVGVEPQGLFEFGPRDCEIAAQNIRIAFVIKKPRGFALEFRRGPVGVICEIEPPQSIVTRRQSDPRHHVLWRFFNRILEILLREAEIAVVEALGAQPDRLIGRVVLHVARILSGDRIGDGRRREAGLVARRGQQRQRHHQNQPGHGLNADAENCTLTSATWRCVDPYFWRLSSRSQSRAKMHSGARGMAPMRRERGERPSPKGATI